MLKEQMLDKSPLERRAIELLEKFKYHVGVGSWFSSLEYASNSFMIDERAVWEDESFKATLKYPPSFTPDDVLRTKDVQDVDDVVQVQENTQKTNKQDNFTKDNNVRGVTHSKEEDKESFCSGQFRRSVGGILCAWDPRMFHKHNATISDYFVAIQGEWIANAKKYLVISFYAPQKASEKRMLWSYLNYMIDRWDGESILMGDFNEVRHKEERFGSIFNNHNAMVFNSFISSSGLVEVLLGGCAFTWCHKSGSKMSKLDPFLISKGIMGFCPNITSITLDRYLSNHRPIILREELLNKRMNVINSIHDLEKLEATEIAQKAKIKWSIEGDENSKFFHGILNKKRNQHAIHGILSEGEFPNKLSADWSIDLESNVTIGEIKRAVWDCDGPFILAELIHWCHAKKKETMIFKVNFGKAYDSVRWDYLDDVLNNFGFGLNWRNWIHNCLNSSEGSILVNGSPIGEFQFQKGLKQALDCFYMASVLRMNLQKSKLISISVEDEIVSRAASKMRCCTLTTPFLYLRIKVGGSMSRIKSWDEIEAKLHSRLSKWKMKTLSSGDALWSRFIRAVHGNRGGIETHSRVSYSLTCLSIVNEVNKMRNKGIDLLKYMKIQVGNGLNTKFLEDVWTGNKNFKTSFPRIYALESDKNLIVADKMAYNDVAFSLRHQPRDGVEMEQFRALSIVIEFCCMTWLIDGNGLLKVWASSLLRRLESLLTIVG
nr:RNA-directed DNA polymerase, eukaryota [Tanacetum cinerariifolium]